MDSWLPPLTDTLAGVDLDRWYRRARTEAIAAGIDGAEVDWLLLRLTAVERLTLKLGTLSRQQRIPSRVSLERLQALWQRRLQERLPVQYLVGYTEWRHLVLQVTPAVLIPRPETELIIDIAQAAAQASPVAEQLLSGIWVDVGTGSGAIALALATALPLASLYATDASPAALAVAQANAHHHHLAERITFLVGSWLQPLGALRGRVGAIVSNPPYIPRDVVSTLAPEVRCHEPIAALDGGVDGLDGIRELVQQAPDYLVPGGLWITELMQGQAPAVAALLEQQGSYDGIVIHADLGGIERFVLAQRR